MDSIRIETISEPDFDGIVQAAGGARITSDGSADYRLNEAIIELKLIQEEGFEKASRQVKLANLFGTLQPNAPIVVIDPTTLEARHSRDYYNIVAGPIKTHVKKADKQLEATSQRFFPHATRALVIINLGYTALTPDEFQSVCLKCVRNDTNKIDFLIIGGIYFHSDGFDNYVFTRFEPHAINLHRSFPSFDALLSAWSAFVDRFATSIIKETTPPGHGRLPVIDLAFDLEGVRYIKPAPAVPSNFFPSGQAPRANTSALENCPPVAQVFPALTEPDWSEIKRALPHEAILKGTYADYLGFQQQRDTEESTTLEPFVAVRVTLHEFSAFIDKPLHDCAFSDLSSFATGRFDAQIREVLGRIREKKESTILPPEYMHVIIQEIGGDEINDLASLYHVWETFGFQRKEAVFENQQLFLNYALAVAASYAVKRRLDFVFFSRAPFAKF